MPNMELGNLPNEMLEEIFSYVLSSKGSLLSCRLVNRRWNSIATTCWRQLPSTQAQLSTAKSMTEFLCVMNSRIQDFPFNRIRFNVINLKSIEAARTLLMEFSPFIEDLHIVTIKGQTARNRGLFQSFIEQFDISSMPYLVKIRIDSCFKILTPSTLCLEKLHTLDIPISTVWMEKLSNFLVKSAPNLKLFMTSIEYPKDIRDDRIPVWQFGHEYRHIAVIQLKLNLHIKMTNVLRMFTSLLQKFDEWKSIQVTELNLAVAGHNDEGIQFGPQAKERVENLIQSLAGSIRKLEIEMTVVHIKLPVMCNLETLTLNYGSQWHARIEPIEGNQFPSLRNVFLHSYLELCEVFRNAALESVKMLHITNPYYPIIAIPTDSDTVWTKVFPNLESFIYVNRYIVDQMDDLPFFQYILSSLRMKSLTHVAIRATHGLFNSVIPEVQNILSGFIDMKKVLSGACAARENGGKIEEDEYWNRMEGLRSPCLTNMPALTKLHLNFPMDDDVVSGVLARMKPLNKLTIHAKYLSQETIQRLNDRHGTVVFLDDTPKKFKRWSLS